MSTLKLDPSPILLLLVVGGAAWWFMNRKAKAATVSGGALLPAGSGATVYQAPRQQSDPLNPVLNVLGAKLGNWLGTNTPTAVSGPDLNAVTPGPGQWATDANGNGLF